MTTYSKDTIRFAEDLVSHYAKRDRYTGDYCLDISKLSDFELNEFATLLMSESYGAEEANGSDNPHFKTKMLPALINYLKNSTDKDKEIEFVSEWKKGIVNYFYDTMQSIIDDVCYEQTSSEREESGFRAHRHSDNGEIYCSRA